MPFVNYPSHGMSRVDSCFRQDKMLRMNILLEVDLCHG